MQSSVASLVALLLLSFSVGGRGLPTVHCPALLQLLHIQDVSHSYTNDLSNLVAKMPDLAAGLDYYFPQRSFGLVSFSDKPSAPLGDARVDYCYREHVGLGEPDSVFFDALDSLSVLSGADWKESQFDAVKYGAESDGLGWERNDTVGELDVRRVLLLATDSLPHREGDIAGGAGTSCEDSDYPSLEAIRAILQSRGMMLLVVVTNDIYNEWHGLVGSWTEAKVMRLADSVDDIVTAIVEFYADDCIPEGYSLRVSNLVNCLDGCPTHCHEHWTTQANTDLAYCVDRVSEVTSTTFLYSAYFYTPVPWTPSGCVWLDPTKEVGVNQNYRGQPQGCGAAVATSTALAVSKLCMCYD